MPALTTKTLEAELPQHGAVRLTLQAATVLSGMRRVVLAQHARATVNGLELPVGSAESEAMLILAGFTYPTCVAAVTEAEGLDIVNLSVLDFAALPEDFVDAWFAAVIEVCPAWSPVDNSADAEKKAT